MIYKYDKIVDTKKLVFEGQVFEKLLSCFILAIVVVFGVYISCQIFIVQLQGHPSISDYFVALFFPILILLLIRAFCVYLLTKYKLKEIEININKSKAIPKLKQAGINLGWDIVEATENYLVFHTKSNGIAQIQVVTIIFFPDNSIYFNSLNSFRYLLPSKYILNYKMLTEEFDKICK